MVHKAESVYRKKSYGSFFEEDPKTDIAVQPARCYIIPRWYKQEARTVLGLALPLVLTTLFNFLMPSIALMFCGTFGTIQLGGAALAVTVINVFGFAIGAGVGSALDTLLSQTYGAKNLLKIGVIMERGIIIMVIFVVPLWGLHLNITSLLVTIGQDRETSIIAGDYLLYFMPALLFNFIYQALSKYLYNQNILYPNIIVGIIGCCVNAISHTLLVIVGDYGTNGSAVALDITFFSMDVSILFYIRFSGIYKNNWEGFSSDAFQEWGEYFSLAIPGLLMVFVEWGSFEIGTIVSGLLGVVQLDAQSICMQTQATIYMIPLGFSIAANIRVGILLGNNDPIGAKRAARTVLSLVLCSAICVSILLISLRTFIPKMFSYDQEVIDMASNVLIVLGAYEILDSFSSVMGGILRGSGRQAIGAVVIFIGYIVIALPAGICLMFLAQLEVIGLWLGLSAGLFTVNVAYFFLFIRTNWDKQAQDAQVRAGVSELEKQESKATGEFGFDEEQIHDYSTVKETDTLLDKYDRLSIRELILRRGIAIVLVLMILSISVFLRITFQIERCVFRLENGTLPSYNSTLPFCNFSSSIHL